MFCSCPRDALCDRCVDDAFAQLRGVAGVRLGAVTAVQPNDPPWGETLEVMIARWCRDMGVPYLGRAEIGHTQANRVVPFGISPLPLAGGAGGGPV